MSLQDLSTEQLAQLGEQIRHEYAQLKAKNLSLNLTRGKPSAEQLDLSEPLLSLPGPQAYVDAEGNDVRNYGNLKGITDLRSIWAELLGVPVDQVYAADSSSLNIEFDVLSWAYHFGFPDSPRPWNQEETIKWLCPVPGYDRHFSISELFGMEMITVPLRDDGPDMDVVKEAVKDPQVKGMWLVPIYSNPSGATTSREVLEELAAMDTAAQDFRVMADNAYAVHILGDTFPEIHPLLEIAEQAGHPDRFWGFTSTSKITFAGSGVSFLYSSESNLSWYASIAGKRGIGPNKLNQLAHALFLKNAEGVRDLMRRHQEIMAPKFRRAQEILKDRLSALDFAQWTDPQGGYFISVDVLPGTAARTVELAKEAGIALTGSGSSYPLHKDPEDKNIRLAPSLPPLSELEPALDGFCTCAILAAVEKLGA